MIEKKIKILFFFEKNKKIINPSPKVANAILSPDMKVI